MQQVSTVTGKRCCKSSSALKNTACMLLANTYLYALVRLNLFVQDFSLNSIYHTLQTAVLNAEGSAVEQRRTSSCPSLQLDNCKIGPIVLI